MEHEYMKVAREAVVKYYNDRLDRELSYKDRLSYNETFIVWFSKTLQNWKALVSTTLSDGMYFELTYNGDKDVIYLDAYKKAENVEIWGEELWD